MASADSNLKYRYYYFMGKGRGEVCRLMLACAGIDYEDWRFEKFEWDGQFKAQTPFGQCPWLEIDDGKKVTKLCQSHAIARWCARQCGLAGESLLDQAKADMLADCCEDFVVKPCVFIRREQDKEAKAEKLRVFREETLPNFLAKMHQIIEENGGQYLVGNSLTYADILFSHWMLWVNGGVGFEPPLEQYPLLKALKARVEAHPPIAKWMKKRPVTLL